MQPPTAPPPPRPPAACIFDRAASEIGLAIATTGGRILAANRRFGFRAAADASALIGENLVDLIAPADRTRFLAAAGGRAKGAQALTLEVAHGLGGFVTQEATVLRLPSRGLVLVATRAPEGGRAFSDDVLITYRVDAEGQIETMLVEGDFERYFGGPRPTGIDTVAWFQTRILIQDMEVIGMLWSSEAAGRGSMARYSFERLDGSVSTVLECFEVAPSSDGGYVGFSVSRPLQRPATPRSPAAALATIDALYFSGVLEPGGALRVDWTSRPAWSLAAERVPADATLDAALTVVLTAEGRRSFRDAVERCAETGARETVLKGAGGRRLRLRLRRLGPPDSSPRLCGRLTESIESTTGPADAPDGEIELSARQLQILRLLAEGRRNGEIADTLSLSALTVRNHASIVYRKLGVRSRTEAIASARRRGLLQ